MTKNQTLKRSRIESRIAAERAALEARMQALDAEAEEYEAHLEDRLEKAGRARVALVEDLLDRFEIPQGTPRVDKETGEPKLTKDGKPIVINNDPDETKRMERLAEVIDDLVRRAEGTAVEETADDKATEIPEIATPRRFGSYSVDDETEGDSHEATFTSTYDEGDVAS